MITKLENNIENIKALTSYFYEVDSDFEIPLSKKTDLEQYAIKLLSLGIVIVAIEGESIVAVLAGYCNDIINKNANISILSVKQDNRGRGLSRFLVDEMILLCQEKGMLRICVDSVNPIAVKLYKSAGFRIIRTETLNNVKKVYLQFNTSLS